MNVRNVVQGMVFILLCLGLAARADERVLITEFQAANTGPLLDEDGDKSDWIEIHNAGTNAVDLNGWYLTDNNARYSGWRFPGTNLAPGAYLLVFASGKNRRTPGATLHTDFQLQTSGEYLALIKPDGTNVVSAFSPTYPVQVEGVSYGVPVVQTTTTLVAGGAAAKVLVPRNGAAGLAWTGNPFDDSAWLGTTTGVGYEAGGQGPFVPAPLANSQADFSGTQGRSNWFYGYWDKRNDANSTYEVNDFTPFPNSGGAFGANNFFNGAGNLWDWFNGNPPFTELTATGGRPSATNSAGGAWHWAVRRYVNQHAGPVTITVTGSHTSDWVRVTQTGTAANSLLYIYYMLIAESLPH